MNIVRPWVERGTHSETNRLFRPSKSLSPLFHLTIFSLLVSHVSNVEHTENTLISY
jgi:hypothetical protein